MGIVLIEFGKFVQTSASRESLAMVMFNGKTDNEMVGV